MTSLLGIPLADFTTNLSTAIAVGGTTATLQSATDDDGIALPTGRYFFSIDGENSGKEHFSCTLTGTALTNLKSVSRQGVETAGAVRAHRIGATVSLTDFAHLLYMNNLLKGTTTLDSAVPLGYDGTASITTANQLATKAYVDGVAVAGAPNASTTVKGIVQEATQAQYLAKTAVGSTGAELYVNPSIVASTLLNDYKVDTGAANAYVITPAPAITAYTTGQIFSFKAVNANTTASTINVNALGVKTIKNVIGSDLVANDILAGQIVVIEYDGTNFIMISPSGNLTANNLKSATTTVNISSATAPSAGQALVAVSSTAATWQSALSFKSGTTTKNAADASTTQNIAHGLSVTPKYVRLTAIAVVSGLSTFTAMAVYNGTTQSSLVSTSAGAGTTSISTSFILNANNTGTDTQTGVITVDATNVIITWTKNANPTGSYTILWEVFG